MTRNMIAEDMGEKITQQSSQEVERIEELDLKAMVSDVSEGLPCTIDQIYHGPLSALLPMIKNPDTLSTKGKEFLKSYGSTPYYLLECHTVKGDPVKLLLRVSYNPSSNFYKVAKKYGVLRIGTQIDVVYDEKKQRFDFKL